MNSTETINIGLVGASPGRGWSSVAHLPALAVLADFRLSAVATTRPETAAQSAATHGAAHAFTDAGELARCSDVDVVVVCIKAPQHFAAARAAIEAGKHLFCEWPAGCNTRQTQQLAELAKKRGVKGYVVLQTRASPVINHIRELVADGYIGEVMSASMFGIYPHWGARPAAAYSADLASGANLLTISGGHTLDALTHMLGDIDHLSAEIATLIEGGRAVDTGEEIVKTAPDQVTIIGRLVGGALLSAHLLGASPVRSEFRLHVGGTEGELVMESPGLPGNTPVTVSGARGGEDRVLIEIPMGRALFDATGMSQAAINMAHAYLQLARALRGESSLLADLDHAVSIRRTLDVVFESAHRGVRQGAL